MRSKWIFFIVVISAISIAGCGERYGEEKSRLSPRIYKVLIESGVCASHQDCNSKEVMFGEGGDRIYLNVYGLTDPTVIASIFFAVAAEGRALVGDVPISVAIYKEPKSEHLGLRRVLGMVTPYAKLELNPAGRD
ncbi:MAG TPA: hypothetical protein VER09_00420 [Pseudomonas sp.]|nr:hypothetical protein [Pseudomonas sp.]